MARRPLGDVILAIETSCDETAAALVTRDGDITSNIVASQAELHARFGGVVPEVASRRHLELVRPCRSRRTRRGRCRARRSRGDRGHGRARADRRAARRCVGRESARLVATACADPGQPPARSRGVAVSPAPRPAAPVYLPARERRSHDAARCAGARGLPRSRHDARRRRRRGVRQGRPSARARLPRWEGDRRAGAPRRPERVRLPGRARAGPRLLVLGSQDGAPVHRSQALAGRARGAGAPILPRATNGRSYGRSPSGCMRQGPSAWRSSAAWRPTRSSAPLCRRQRWLRSSSAPTTPR